ncbi:MAG TPA: LLM class flavin-dependent oxidoreductase [Solirubrobacteraceae bacterium]|jgi:alkanesulfonate monooxygenase SsuD/methylene tetrahydromethanopterin reductase-like flavin-dependent oxidoreductase (luciferase family)|nr:LLM class flavin-dependent oxidoreductase [Solirubrobacteraceae bacterium]
MPRFGLICPIQDREGDLGTLLAQLREEVLAAERAGFDAFFLPELHQTHAGALSSPMLVCAWLGSHTTRIRMGPLVLAAPLHDPIRLAEDALMLDWATGGRLILGLGVGHVEPDFRLYGRERSARGRTLDELIDLLDLTAGGEPFDFEGEVFARAGQVTPATLTPGGPVRWIGAHAPAGLRRAAERSAGWISDPQRHVDVLAPMAEQYRAAARAAGRPAHVALFRDGWIGESREQAEVDWAPHALKLHRLYYNLGTYLPEFEPWVEQVREREHFTLDVLAPGRFLLGGPREVRDLAGDWLERTGADYIAIRMRSPTGPGHEAALAAIERFGAEVIGPLSSAD